MPNRSRRDLESCRQQHSLQLGHEMMDELRRPLLIVMTNDWEKNDDNHEDEIIEEENMIHVGIVEEETNDDNHSGFLEDDEISEEELRAQILEYWCEPIKIDEEEGEKQSISRGWRVLWIRSQ